MKYRKATLRQFALPGEAVQHVRKNIRALRIEAVRDLLHRVRHGEAPKMGLLIEHLRLDPLTYLTLVPFALAQVVGAGTK